MHPGLRSAGATGEDRYKATLTVALAAITGTYEGTIVLSDKAPPSSYRMRSKGRAGPDSSRARPASPSAPTAATPSSTSHGQVHTGGPIARLGQRLIANVSKMMQDRFFANLQRHV